MYVIFKTDFNNFYRSAVNACALYNACLDNSNNNDNNNNSNNNNNNNNNNK